MGSLVLQPYFQPKAPYYELKNKIDKQSKPFTNILPWAARSEDLLQLTNLVCNDMMKLIQSQIALQNQLNQVSSNRLNYRA